MADWTGDERALALRLEIVSMSPLAGEGDPNEGSSGDPIEDLIARCLAEPDERRAAAFDAVCREHPPLERELRARVSALAALGIDVLGASRAAHEFPERLGDFRLIAPLGGGGMGVVYVAEQTSLGREVALKLIRPEHLYFPGARERFRRETEAVARLQHTGIVPIYMVGEADGIPYFAMERIRGCTLSRVLQALEPRAPESLTGRDLATLVAEGAGVTIDQVAGLPLFAGTWIEASLEIVRQVAEALQHAHDRRIVHRDIKPSNVAIAADGRAILLDFGLTSSLQADRLTRTGSQVGTPAYMAPEQLSGKSEIGPATDVYSLGVTLYELLTLQVPYRGDARSAIQARILKGEPDAIRARNRRVGADVETVCLKAMDRERVRRYATALDLARDLGNVLAHRPIEARRPGAWLRGVRWVQRNRALAAALLLALVLLTGVPTALFLQQHHYSAKLEQALSDAQRDAETSRTMFGFLGELFNGANPSVSGHEPSVRELLDRGVEKLEGAFPERPEVRSVLLERIGSVYAQLGAYEKARLLLERALAIMDAHPEQGWSESSFRNDPQSGQVWRANVQSSLAEVHQRSGQPARAEELLRSALRVYEEVDGPQGLRVATVLSSLGNALVAQGRAADAEPLQRRSLAILRANPRAEPADVAVVSMNLGSLLHAHLGRSGEAREFFEFAVASFRASGRDQPLLADALNNLGLHHLDGGRFREADPLFQEAIAIARRVLPASDRLATYLFNRARLLLIGLGDPEAAVAGFEEAHDILAAYPWEQPARLANDVSYGSTLVRLGLFEDADRVFSELMPHLREHPPAEQPLLLRAALESHALCLEHLGQSEAAKELRREVR